ncbi:hypothetical protein KKF59_00500, partial [Patescibacteria group bacterium]|nr:hypothetical protein [Patescibacteria group bacterium]MBU1629929.1 hypothetical protein [Patescibacteria group bacterium]MBU1907596.1 hypothetical protein [Patescibacteria group bacterium]
FRYLDHAHCYSTDEKIFTAHYDIVIIFDSGDLQYCGVVEHMKHLPAGYLLVNIDHHPTNEGYGDINLVYPDCSSTAEVVARFFKHCGIEVDAKIATSLLTGLITDTGTFSNAATTSASMTTAAEMFSAGARFGDIAKNVQNNKTVASLKLWGILLDRLQYHEELNMVTTYMLQKDADDVGDATDGFTNFLNSVAGHADTIMFLKELPGGEVKGAFRSVKCDVSKLAKLLGGGGHKNAAAFTIKGRIKETDDGVRITGLAL